jgi:hypothetical protein
MALWTNVELNDNGQVTPDDGQSSWSSTMIYFGWGRRQITADVHVDGYSGKAVASILHDGLGLSAQLLERLAIALYWSCGTVMRETLCELGFALVDLEGVLRRLFYRGDAERMLRKFRAAATSRPAAKQSIPVA